MGIFVFVFLLVWSVPLMAEPVALFLPERQSMEWLLTEHEGGKKFRGGDTCNKCHGGDEQAMSKAPLVQLDATFTAEGDRVRVNLSWRGEPTTTFAIMKDAGQAKAFARAGCWAGCHDDIRGMDGTQEKYLGQTRAKMTRTGGGQETKDAASIAAMRAEGNYVEVFQFALAGGTVNAAKHGAILETTALTDYSAGQATATWQDGQWRLGFLMDTPPDAATTLGFALLVGGDGAHGTHYVSLPHTLGRTADGRLVLESP